MVTNVTSLSGNGLKDWLIQRVTAIYLALFALFVVGFVVWHPGITYGEWFSLFDHAAMKLATVLALLCILMHAWIGLWTITTDYLKSTALRIFIQMGILTILLLLVIWGIMILWGQ